MNYTKEQRRQIYQSLPQDLKEALVSIETSEKIAEIANKYNLLLDQTTELGDELNLYMLGLTKQKDLIGNISKRLNVDFEKTRNILTDVNEKIINPVRISLQKIQEAGTGEVEESPTPPPPRPVIKAQPAPSPEPVPTTPIAPAIQTPYTRLQSVKQEMQSAKVVESEDTSIDSHKEIKKIEEMGNFKIDKHIPGQYDFEDHMDKADLMKVIEEPEEIVEHLLPKGEEVKKERVVVKAVPGQKGDPYREPLI